MYTYKFFLLLFYIFFKYFFILIHKIINKILNLNSNTIVLLKWGFIFSIL